MWFAYMDEAGNTGDRLDDPEQPIHVITSVIVPEDLVSEVHRRVRSVAASRYLSSYRAPGFEFHGADIYGNRGSFARVSVQDRIDTFEHFARQKGSTDRVLLVSDENRERERTALRDLASYQDVGTSWGWSPVNITRIIDTIHFVQSESN